MPLIARWLRLARTVLMVLFVGCTSEGPSLTTLEPAVAVVPDALDFGEVGVPLTSTAPVFLSNVGQANLVARLSWPRLDPGASDGPDVFSIDPDVAVTDGETELVVGPGEEVRLDVTFAPDTFRDYATTLRIDTNDPETPVSRVEMVGVGADLPLPDVEIRPQQTIEVADLPVGQRGLLAFEVANVGGSDLGITSLRLEGPDTFVLETERTGSVVVPGDSATVLVSYVPTQDEGEFADAFVVTNDPDEPETQVRLVVNGGGPDLERPVAIVDCPSQVLLSGPELVPLSASKSFDPAGFEPLFYRWEVLERPQGSDPDRPLDPDDTEDIDLYVDVAGEYTVELVVLNALFTASEPVRCVFEARPEDQLRVELSWDGPTADLDLHLMRDGGELFDPVDDCHYCNTSPSWGPDGSVDDPRLDLDDRGGFGPENINIEAPAEGTYDVAVHTFSPREDGAVVATVRVWLLGDLVWSGSRVLAEENEVWRVGTATMPQGQFVASTVAHDSVPGGCR